MVPRFKTKTLKPNEWQGGAGAPRLHSMASWMEAQCFFHSLFIKVFLQTNRQAELFLSRSSWWLACFVCVCDVLLVHA